LIVPTFIVAGAPRCATTALHYYLQAHPQVCMSAIKEPAFFLFGPDGEPSIAEPPIIRKSVRRLDDYTALFRPLSEHRAIGDATPLYLFTPEAPERIAELCGVVPIICLVRHPAERAWSHFLHAVPTTSHEEATEQFAQLVREEMAGTHDDEPYRTRTHLVRLGRYGEQVDRFQKVFGPDQVHVMLTDDLKVDKEGALERITTAIGVDHFSDLPFEQVNESGQSPSGVRGAGYRVARAVQPTIKAVLPPRIAGSLARRRAQMTSRIVEHMPPIDAGLRAEIAAWCAEDVVLLESLIDRDLSAWMAPRRPASIPA
jgi:hypothetical protein